MYTVLGGIYGSIGFIGCMRLITIDGNYMLPTDWKLGVITDDAIFIFVPSNDYF